MNAENNNILSGQKLYERLCDVISVVENTPEISLSGLKTELEKTLAGFENSKDQLYLEINRFYKSVCTYISRHEENRGPNQVGDLAELDRIKQSYLERKKSPDLSGLFF